MRGAPAIAVIGPGEASAGELAMAEDVGAALAAAGCVVVTGGLGGVMEAASRGARSRLGSTIGFLPGSDPDAANGWVELPIATGMGEGRDALVVAAARGLIAIGGGYGTLAELALALRAGKPVVGIGSWDIAGVEPAADAASAVERISALTA